MNIAILIEAWEPIWGGGQAHVWELSKALAASHHCTIDIFTMNLGEITSSHDQAPNVSLHRIGRKRNFFSTFDRITWMIEVIRAVRKRHRHTPYDLIHAHANLPGIPGKILSLLLGIPVIYTVHGSNLLDLKNRSFTAYIERIVTTKIRYTREISVTRQLLSYPNTNHPIIIENGVAMDRFVDARKKTSQERYQGTRTLLFIGRLDAVKGIDLLLHALHRIRSNHPELAFSLTLGGYGYEENAYRKLCHDLALDTLVTFTGKLDEKDVARTLAEADIFVLPSRSEGFPLTLLEAWASSLPVVATAVGEIPYLIQDQVNGFLTRPEDIDDLVRTLTLALSAPADRLISIGNAGRTLVAQHFTWETVAKKTYALYDEVR